VGVASRSFSRHPVLRAELQRRYSQARFNDAGLSLQGDELVRFLSGCGKAIIAMERVDARLLEALPDLRVISKYGVGLDGLDLDAIEARGVALGWTGGVNRRSVAELVVAYAIALLHGVPAASDEVRRGVWKQVLGRQLSGRTVGVIGCGHVGKEVCVLMRAFQCRLLAHDIEHYGEFYREHRVEAVTLDELLLRADVVSLHVPLDRSTRQMLSRERVAQLRPGAVLINCARGGLVDEEAVADAIRDRRISGAAFDVLATEPPVSCELARMPNVIVSPHIGGSTEEAVLAMGRAAIDGLESVSLPSQTVPAYKRERA
jgi:phosphoglycerate dehydrogenase-like enzyme